MEQIGNYDKLCLFWQAQVQHMDWASLCLRLPELTPEGDYFTIIHFGRKYGIHYKTGVIIPWDDDDPANHDEQLNIYTLLGYCKDGAQCAGRWVPFRDVKGASPFAPAYDRHILKPLAATFSGRLADFRRAAAAIGGTPLPHSDAGFLLHGFQCIPMKFLFWDGDDEFPAQANILYDASVTDFIHVESTVSLASEGLRRLANTAGLPVAGNAFGM